MLLTGQTASSQYLHLFEVFKTHFKCNKGLWQHSVGLEEWSQLNENTNKWLKYCRNGEKHSKTTVDFYPKHMVLSRVKWPGWISIGSGRRNALGSNEKQFFQMNNVIIYFHPSWKDLFYDTGLGFFSFLFFFFSVFIIGRLESFLKAQSNQCLLYIKVTNPTHLQYLFGEKKKKNAEIVLALPNSWAADLWTQIQDC